MRRDRTAVIEFAVGWELLQYLTCCTGTIWSALSAINTFTPDRKDGDWKLMPCVLLQQCVSAVSFQQSCFSSI